MFCLEESPADDSFGRISGIACAADDGMDSKYEKNIYVTASIHAPCRLTVCVHYVNPDTGNVVFIGICVREGMEVQV